MSEQSADGSEQFNDLENDLLTAFVAGKLVKKVTIGTGYFDPVYPFHGAIRQCPFCGDLYRRHGGHADHRDKCEAGPSPGSNPMRPPGGGSA